VIRHVIEAYHDFNVRESAIDSSSKRAQLGSRRWHKADVVQWAYGDLLLVALFLNLNGLEAFKLIFLIPFVRWFVLDTMYNVFAKQKVWYLSDYGLDGFIKRMFDHEKLAWWFKLFLFVVSIIMFYIIKLCQ